MPKKTEWTKELELSSMSSLGPEELQSLSVSSGMTEMISAMTRTERMRRDDSLCSLSPEMMVRCRGPSSFPHFGKCEDQRPRLSPLASSCFPSLLSKMTMTMTMGDPSLLPCQVMRRRK